MPVFGFLKADLVFKRFSIRGKSKVKKEIGFIWMAVNLRKYAANIIPNHDLYKNMKKVEIKFYLISTFLFLTSYVPASSYFSLVMSQLSVLWQVASLNHHNEKDLRRKNTFQLHAGSSEKVITWKRNKNPDLSKKEFVLDPLKKSLI